MKDILAQHPYLLAAALVILMLVGCTTGDLQSTSKALIQAKIADILLQSGEPKNVVLSVDLTEGELNQVLHAIEAYQLVRARWQSIVDDPTAIITNTATLQTDYLNLASEYAAVHAIVEFHWNEYTPAQQIQLAQYHARAAELGESLRNLLVLQDRRKALNTALELGLTIAKIMAV